MREGDKGKRKKENGINDSWIRFVRSIQPREIGKALRYTFRRSRERESESSWRKARAQPGEYRAFDARNTRDSRFLLGCNPSMKGDLARCGERKRVRETERTGTSARG